nr:Brevis radix-like domain-containing protein [Tanacetum cinerariifolium]
MQQLRQSQKLSKSHQDMNSEVYVSNSESPSTAKPIDQTKKSKLSYAHDFDFQANKGSKSKSDFDFQANRGSKTKSAYLFIHLWLTIKKFRVLSRGVDDLQDREVPDYATLKDMAERLQPGSCDLKSIRYASELDQNGHDADVNEDCHWSLR